MAYQGWGGIRWGESGWCGWGRGDDVGGRGDGVGGWDDGVCVWRREGAEVMVWGRHDCVGEARWCGGRSDGVGGGEG